MDLSALRLELKSRLGDFLGDIRANRLINEAYQGICEDASWPFLETTTTGAAPLTIADLRQILYVTDTVNLRMLDPVDVRQIAAADPNFTAGTPYLYWLSDTTINPWPVSTVSLSVRYLKVPPDLALDTDTPLIPSRFQLMIVDCAHARALAEGPNPNESNLARAQAVEQVYESRLQQMRNSLLDRSLDGPAYMLAERKNY